MKPDEAKRFFSAIREFADNPSELSFNALRSDETMAHMVKASALENPILLTEKGPPDEQVAVGALRSLCESVKDDDMAMALLHAVQVNGAFELLAERIPNNWAKA